MTYIEPHIQRESNPANLPLSVFSFHCTAAFHESGSLPIRVSIELPTYQNTPATQGRLRFAAERGLARAVSNLERRADYTEPAWREWLIERLDFSLADEVKAMDIKVIRLDASLESQTTTPSEPDDDVPIGLLE